MKRRFTILTAALALLTFLAFPMGMRGQAPVNTLLWGETWTDGAANATPSSYGFSGTTVYGGGTLTYDQSSTNTKLYAEALAGGTSPELLLSKNNQTWTISNIPTGQATEMSLSFLSNKTTFDVTSTTSGITISGSQKSWTIEATSTVSNFELTIKNTGSGNARIDDIELKVVTAGTGGGSQLTPSDLALVDAPVELEFDLYDNATAQTISYTTSSTGAVTVSQSDYITATVNANSTITVIPVAVTNGPQTITVNQAADDTYQAGSVTFTVDIEDSTPTTGSDVTFDATVDKDLNNTTQGQGSIVKNGVTFTCSDGILGNGTEYRLYKNSTTTFSVESGTITQIVFTCTSNNPASGFSTQTGWTTNGSNGTWTGNATSVSFVASSKQVRATTIVVTVETSSTSDPTISADDVNIAYDAEEGTINYTINNPVEGGSLVASCDAEWIVVDDTPQTDAEGSIDFLCAPNSNFYAHSATVTLTYTYDDSKATVTKIVTVTQALDPDANGSTIDYPIMVSEAIDAIDEVGTVSNIYVGGIVSNIETEYSSQYHNITFDMIDEEGNEYFLRAYRCGGDEAADVTVGDEVIVYGNLTKYGSIYEFGQGCELVSLIHPAVPSIAVSPESVELDAEEGEGAMDITYENLTITAASDFDIQYYNEQGVEISEPDWILVEVNEKVLSKDDATYEVTYTIEANNGPARTAYFKVYAMDDETNLVYSNLVTISQAAAPQQYTLTVEPFENLELITFVNDEMVMEGDGEIQVTEGNQIMLRIVALEGYVMETLMVNGVNHVNDIAADYTYSFDMPAENVIISATAVEDVPPTPGDKYVKVTSTADLTSGQYLIVYEDGSLAFDGSLETLDATSNTIEVTINDSEIGIDNITIASEFTIDVTTGTIMSASGYYIGQTSNANGMQTSLETAYTNTISFDESGNANIVSSGGAYLRYNSANNQNRFRYYRSSTYTGQKAIQLYKKVGEPATETYTLEIAGYGDSDGGYYLIASPAAIKPATVEDPETHENMILIGDDAVNYDLYAFDESEDDEWRNYKAQAFNLQPGKGYLYAHKRGGNFAIVGVPYSGDGKVTLQKTEGNYWEGWNLIGNPWGTNATIETEEGQEVSFYVMGEDGKSFIAGDNNVGPMQGIFVIAAIDEQEVTFVPAETPAPGEGKLIVNLTASRSSVIDRAIVRFGQGTELPKFMFNPNSTKIYIPQSGEDYAVVRSAGEAEMPVNFKAAQNGTYTLSINPANVEMEYLHLVDNMTGTDIDLLATPSYTFEASTTDAANRFSLMYGVETGVNEDKAVNFAYFNGSQWVVNNSGEATLQVVDALGRVVSTKTINGNAEVSIDQTAGVYMIRLINGNNVKTQKVVVK